MTYRSNEWTCLRGRDRQTSISQLGNSPEQQQHTSNYGKALAGHSMKQKTPLPVMVILHVCMYKTRASRCQDLAKGQKKSYAKASG